VKTFQFPLQRVFDWRALQMRAEEEKLSAMQHRLGALVHRENALTAAELKSSLGLLKLSSIGGGDLQALAAFQLRMKNERGSLKAARLQLEKQVAEQRTRLLKARRDFRVLEKLREKRWKEWQYLADREIEDVAAEAYLAKWARAADPHEESNAERHEP
jgi:flagellar export protein FliJ